ncbi:hypothetical protein VCR4J5_380001 [Vibrio crassostreae]|uniref:Uncharacterized protein n=1 Tax=Vibrio crassostreae TaxID=246167 RepID=A0A822N0C7_9VIBR|nr:hypothetical protein VCRA2134O405_1410001 [Vibrio crassostreae]CAK2653751.1 hypothetical protein VCRA2120O56_1300001 [Vibrio crassostreae]CAK3086285.1 hypothetical protein VCRA2123O75_720001 [Vibrio crassostreae]CAK3611813.1 hypothetical protein VCRA2120O64_810001 [Vibrio crassostreae]CDT17732.1 hypothetical protein VCR19J5_1370002 [Vibrio crassostreae]
MNSYHESTVAGHLRDYVLSEKIKPENGCSQSKLSATQTIAYFGAFRSVISG